MHVDEVLHAEVILHDDLLMEALFWIIDLAFAVGAPEFRREGEDVVLVEHPVRGLSILFIFEGGCSISISKKFKNGEKLKIRKILKKLKI